MTRNSTTDPPVARAIRPAVGMACSARAEPSSGTRIHLNISLLLLYFLKHYYCYRQYVATIGIPLAGHSPITRGGIYLTLRSQCMNLPHRRLGDRRFDARYQEGTLWSP